MNGLLCSDSSNVLFYAQCFAKETLRKRKGVVECGAVGPSFDGSTFDVLISKFDKNGNEEWYKRLGGSDFDGAFTGYETFNGDLNILCQTASTDGDVKNNHGSVDEWIIRLGHCGNYIADDAASTDDAIVVTKNNTAIILYPNPAKDIIRVDGLNTSAKTTLSLFSISGKLIQQSTSSGESYQFNIQNLAAGSYYVTIQSGEKISSLKFVKE